MQNAPPPVTLHTAGNGLTVIVLVVKQPVEMIPHVILNVPTLMPVTTPLEEPTTATDDDDVLHTQPEVATVRVMEDPVQTVDGPDIAAGSGCTVIVLAV